MITKPPTTCPAPAPSTTSPTAHAETAPAAPTRSPTGWVITGHKDHLARIEPCARCGLMVRYGVEVSHPGHLKPVQVSARCSIFMIGRTPPRGMKHDVPPPAARA